MADNVGYTPGSGAVIAADDIGGVLHQRMKLGIGGDGVAVDVSETNPMPVVNVNHEDLLLMLTRMLSVLARPVNYDASLNRQRMTTILESGTVTTVTTCTTVTNMTNFGTGRAATEAQDNMNRTAWALVHRARIT